MTDDDALSAYARQLFGTEPDPEPEQPPDPVKGNHSPREGNNPTGQGADADLRTFTAELFRRAD